MSEIVMSVSCRDCVRQSTPACQDCLVSFVLGSEPDVLELDSTDAGIATLLATEGLVPALRYVPRGA